MHGNWCVHMYIPLMAVCLYHIVVLVTKVVDSFNYGAVNFHIHVKMLKLQGPPAQNEAK